MSRWSLPLGSSGLGAMAKHGLETQCSSGTSWRPPDQSRELETSWIPSTHPSVWGEGGRETLTVTIVRKRKNTARSANVPCSLETSLLSLGKAGLPASREASRPCPVSLLGQQGAASTNVPWRGPCSGGWGSRSFPPGWLLSSEGLRSADNRSAFCSQICREC